MRHCNHSHWISPSIRDKRIFITQSDRAQTLLHNLPHAESQSPSLFVLVGSNAKASALRQFITLKNKKSLLNKRGEGEIHLNIDPSSVFGDRPILLADGNFPKNLKQNKAFTTEKCHEVGTRIVDRDLPLDIINCADEIYSRLLYPFTDAFCFFANDMGGLHQIAHRLALWLKKGQPTDLPVSTYPQIIIVTEFPRSEMVDDSHIIENFLSMIQQETIHELSSRFSSMHIVNIIPEGDISIQARYRQLREHLMKASDQVRSARARSRTLFSAHHVAAFMHHAFLHLISTNQKPFNFISTSRISVTPIDDLSKHLQTFLSKIENLEDIKSFAIPMISSSLLLTTYPPDGHRFCPSLAFLHLYKDLCKSAYISRALESKCFESMMLPSEFLQKIEQTIAQLFQDLINDDVTESATIHKQTLQKFQSRWISISSLETCLVCLWHRPQYELPCGHYVCENCVRIFGTICDWDPWLYAVSHCFLCGQDTSGVLVKTKPKTAGIRVLSIDGGGTRGRVPCEVLKLLQDKIGLPYPVQNHFDVVFATSVGAILALVGIVQGWSIEECIAVWEYFATGAFKHRRNIFMAFLKDGRYPPENLESILQEVLSKEQTILGFSAATVTGTKIGLPVTSIGDASVCIFTNYNAIGLRPSENDYHVISLKDGQAKPRLWEIARCGSAAPSYFSAKHIEDLGTFQDGGLRHNNPINLAYQELKAIYSKDEEPSLVVSLGTGSTRQNSTTLWPATRGIWKDGFIPRLIRAFISSPSMSGKSVWHEFQSRHRAGEKGQYFRFDIEFDGSGPRLDDTTKLTELRDMTRESISKSSELDRLAMCIISELFFFELEALPRKENGKYVCTGYILCRLRAGTEAFSALIKQLARKSSTFQLEEQVQTGYIKDSANFDRGGNFYKKVCFDVSDKNHQISIQLREGTSPPCHISGSPFTVNQLITAQRLDAAFGRLDHVKRKRIGNSECLPRKRQRL